jgi:hypothetical protein
MVWFQKSNKNCMNEYLKIETQDGLVYFDKFDEAQLIHYKNDSGKIVLNISVSADASNRSKKKIKSKITSRS